MCARVCVADSPMLCLLAQPVVTAVGRCCFLSTGVCSRTVVLSLLHAAEGRPQHLLVLMLLRALQQGSIGAGQLVLSFSQMPAGPGLLRQHIKVRQLL